MVWSGSSKHLSQLPVRAAKVRGLHLLPILEAFHKHSPKANSFGHQAQKSSEGAGIATHRKTYFYTRGSCGASEVFGQQMNLNHP
jgi:hypothetical protein